MPPRAAVLVFGVLALAASPAASQDRPPIERMGGPVVERLFDEDDRITVLGYRWTDLRRSGRGFDGLLGLAPRTLAAGALSVQADAGLVQALPAGPVRLLLAGGISNFVELAQSLEFYPGLYVGLAVLVPVDARPAVRVDLSRRVYLAAGGTYPLWSIGLSLPVSSRRSHDPSRPRPVSWSCPSTDRGPPARSRSPAWPWL